MATIKNAASLADIKETMVNNIAPKYFDDIENLTELNLGVFGYVTEILANTTKDSYGTIANLFKEMFVAEAELPESIYSHASVFQLSNIFANCASVPFTILIAEDALLANGSNGAGYTYFDIDANMEFSIDGIPFMLDYDVEITSKLLQDGYIHSSQYLMDHENAISKLANPYIRTSIYINSNKKRYVMLEVNLHQVQKKTITNTILSNDIIDIVTLEYQFDNSLANFEIYYKAPGDVSYTQLKKRLYNTTKIDQPFCFYRLIDDNKLEISFANDDNFFKPVYNSDIIVELYTTYGTKGNFETYEGDDIKIIGKSDKYSNNRGVVFLGTPIGSSTGGTDRSTLEKLQEDTVKAYSTIKSFSTSGDLNLYFSEYTNAGNSKVTFMKKRDDAFERLYSAFILFKDTDNNVVPTNTMDMRIFGKDISFTMAQSHRSVVPAGKVYEYIQGQDSNYVQVAEGISIADDLDPYEGTTRFLYVNPFLTVLCTNPISVGFYQNTVTNSLPVSHVNITSQSFYQFIIDRMNVSRDAIGGEDYYTVYVEVAPIIKLPLEPMQLVKSDTKIEDDDRTFVNDFDGYTFIDRRNMKCIVEFLDSGGGSGLFVDLELVGFDYDVYKFKGKLYTNDYISTNNQVQMIDGFLDSVTFSENGDPVLLPATNGKFNIYVLYINPDNNGADQTHELNRFPQLNKYTLTNKYTSMQDNYNNFVIPVEEIRSTIDYIIAEDTFGTYGYKIESVPLIKANYMKVEGIKQAFIKNFNNVYLFIRNAKNSLTNNFNIDMKFFNTYGLSEHYYIANRPEEYIDRINVSMQIDVRWESTANEEAQNTELKNYIKEFLENIGLNATQAPSFYVSSLIYACKDKFTGLKYMVVNKINDYDADVQVLESDVNESNIIQGVIETSKVIPEYLNVDHVIKNGVMTAQINIRNIH